LSVRGTQSTGLAQKLELLNKFGTLDQWVELAAITPELNPSTATNWLESTDGLIWKWMTREATGRSLCGSSENVARRFIDQNRMTSPQEMLLNEAVEINPGAIVLDSDPCLALLFSEPPESDDMLF